MLRRILVLTLLGLGPAIADEHNSSPTIGLQELLVDSSGRGLRVSLAIFASKDFVVRVIDNLAEGDQPKFTNLADAMKACRCVAGCNGGFFERHPFSSVGLMISDGQRFGRFDPASWMKGLVVVRGGRATLESAESFQDSPGITELIQTGPWLVQAGRSESDSSRTQLARRTFICHNGHGLWAIGASDPCTLHELAKLLKGPEISAVLEVQSALNFDGGPSTGLWVEGSSDNFYLPERWPVRNYLGIAPRAIK
jgi:Phosphodiester glycosidase